ncbi:MAG: DUF4956 domain-containing protein [Bacteroidetes bacterium]|nr:DUF4956 domain-containing protein [Bacteroidota bacterium]
MQDKWALFQKFLITENAKIDLTDFIINSIIIVILALILELTYTRCAKSLSNRKLFANNFLLIGFTTMLIIVIVKSSLALSLGLVGALSIVRFRSAVKEPEELAYLFLTISIGLGLGANQRIITVLAYCIILLIIWIRYFITIKSQSQNLFITVYSPEPLSLKLDDIIAVIKQFFKAVELKRYDEDKGFIETAFLVEITKISTLQACKSELQKLSNSVKVSFVDNKNY